VTSDKIPLPWGGTTTSGIVLSTGLNNFLVPREQFLDSPFVQSILLGKETQYSEASATPTLLGYSGVSKLLDPFDGANLSVDLSAYWQNRSIVGTGTIPVGTKGAGTPGNSSLAVNVTVATSTSSNNTGGVAANPALYDSIGAPPALQAIFTLNVSSTAMFDVLLAGLLDNTSGGVNGTFKSITNLVGSLGFVPSVSQAIANTPIDS
jgi:hypothetical protein